MTKHSQPPGEVVRYWRDAELPEEAAADTASAAQRQALVDSLQRRLEETVSETNTARRRWRFGLVAGAVLASAAALAIWYTGLRHEPPGIATMRSVEGSVSVTHAGTPPDTAAVTHETTLVAGDKLATAPDGHTSLQLGSGVSLTLGAASRLHLPDAPASAGREQVRLDQGVVEVRVPHLASGHSFSVKTPDAEVIVHGTAFTVEVGELVATDQPLRHPSGAGPLTTRVRVSEGVVAVSSAGREVLVERGMQWVSPRAEPAALQPAPEASAPSVATASSLPAPSPPPAFKAPPSKLAEQTALLQTASQASRQGNPRGAITALNDLLRRYPDSSLAHEARIQLFRALGASGDAAGAAREARRYLAAYPNGPAREEAQKVALPH